MKGTQFLTGVIVGVVVGLLLAPEKGEDLREDILDSAENLKKKLSRIVKSTGTELKDLRKMLEHEVEGIGDDVRHRILTLLEETTERSNGMKKKIAKEIHS